MATLKTRSW